MVARWVSQEKIDKLRVGEKKTTTPPNVFFLVDFFPFDDFFFPKKDYVVVDFKE